MTRQEFLEKLGETIDSDAPLTGVENLKDMEGWDSMAAVMFMALADEACGVEVVPKDMAGCNTVNDLVALVSAGIEGTADTERQ